MIGIFTLGENGLLRVEILGTQLPLTSVLVVQDGAAAVQLEVDVWLAVVIEMRFAVQLEVDVWLAVVIEMRFFVFYLFVSQYEPLLSLCEAKECRPDPRS